MSLERLEGETTQPNYLKLEELLNQISGPNGVACRNIYTDYGELFKSAPGSSHNHQAWPGGYVDHITETMNIASVLYDTFNTIRKLPFEKSDALLVMYLHDLEKPFKFSFDTDGNLVDNPEIPDKEARAAKRIEVMGKYGIKLSPVQENAMLYVEGIRDDKYTNQSRVMWELAALCHLADTWSARGWYNYPLPGGEDPWQGAARVNSAATQTLGSEAVDQSN